MYEYETLSKAVLQCFSFFQLYQEGKKGAERPLEHSVISVFRFKFKPSLCKLKEYSYVIFFEENNGSGPESLGFPVRKLWGTEPP